MDAFFTVSGGPDHAEIYSSVTGWFQLPRQDGWPLYPSLTPADVYFGRGRTILLQRERIKWRITPLGRRCQSAMLRASSTTCQCKVVAIDQPTIRRLNASSTTAR